MCACGKHVCSIASDKNIDSSAQDEPVDRGACGKCVCSTANKQYMRQTQLVSCRERKQENSISYAKNDGTAITPKAVNFG